MFCLSNGILNFGSLCIKVLSSPNIHVTYTRTSNPTRNACWITRIGALLFALFLAFPYVCFAGQLISIWRGLIISLEFLLPQVWYPSRCPSCGRGLPPTGWSRASWAAALLVRNCILLPKLFWPTARKNCSSDREKLLKFETEGKEFSKILRSLEQFVQTVKGQNNFW